MNHIMNAIVQVITFSLIPFIWWLITARKECSFFNWIGLKGIKRWKGTRFTVMVIIVLLAYFGVSIGMLYIMKDAPTASSEFTGLGMKGFPAVLIFAFVKTALAEEILFRGFLLKRLMNKFGFRVANALQAILFGLLHGVLFFNFTNPLIAILIILFTGDRKSVV